MALFKHVLYPTDLSDAARPALRYAANIARWSGARLTVMHVVPGYEPVVVPAVRLGVPAQVAYLPSETEVLEELRRVVAGEPLEGLEVSFVSSVGEPVRVIVDRAASAAVDLVVMGTHGRSGFDRLLSGSVTEKVLRRAPCPVLTIPPQARGAVAAGTPFARVLCGVDFSPSSQAALGLAFAIAREASAELTVIHVVEWLAEEEPRAHAHFNVAEYRRYVLDDARARLDALVAAQPAPGRGVDVAMTFGRAHRELLRIVAEKNSDIVVMGAQGLGSIGLALFGSATQHVVRAAACPVLVVREAGASS